MRMLLSIAIVSGLVYAGMCGLAYFNQERMLFLPNIPSRQLVATPADAGLAFENVRFTTSDGVELHAWLVPASGATETLIFFHGNAGNISHRLDSLLIFNRLGLNVLIVDYRGYGASDGKPSEQGTYLDALAAWQFLVEQRGVAPESIVLFGRSLGGAVAAWLATQHPPAALILESTWTSVPDVAARHYWFMPVRTLAKIDYRSIEHMASVDFPVLILHSENDEIIPYAHGQALFDAVNDPRKQFFTMRGGHNDGFLRSGADYQRTLADFLDVNTGGS